MAVNKDISAFGIDFRELWVTFAAASLGALSLVFPSGYSIGAFLLLLWSIYMLWERGIPELPKGVWVLSFVMAAYAVFHIADAWFRGEGLRGFDQPSRFIFAIPCLVALFHMQPRWAWVWGGVALGGLSAGIIAYYQRFHEGVGRVHGFMGPEHYGNQSTLLCLLSLVAIFWGSVVARSRLLIIAGVVGFVGGGYGALLSGTRAAWLSALILVPLILLVAIYFRFYKTASALLFSTVMLGFISAGNSEFGVQQRIESSVNEVASYFDGDVRGSAGLRLELWRSAQILFSERPFIGYGQTAYQERITTLAEEGVINHQVSRFNHIHNDWMNALAKGGILGFLVLLGVYLAPITLAAPNVIKPRDIPSGLLAVACLVIVGNFLMYGLMHNALGANNGVITYVFWMVLFVSGAISAFRERADAI